MLVIEMPPAAEAILELTEDAEMEIDFPNVQPRQGGSFDIHSLPAENNIDSVDEFPFYDVSESAPRKTLWGDIKATLKAYFDKLYLTAAALVGYATKEWVQLQGYGTYSKPADGIPKSDMSADVEAGLNKAATALQPSALNAYRTSAAQDIIDNSKVDKVAGKGLSANDYTDADKSKVQSAASTAYVDSEIAAATNDMATQTWVSSRGYITASDIPVLSVNGKTGAVVLTAADLGIGSVFNLKGSKPTVSALPATGNSIGDVWYVVDESVGYIWLNDGIANRWEMLGMSVDLSSYATKAELTAALAGYVEKVAGKGLSTNDYTDADKSKLASAITSLAGYATEQYVNNYHDDTKVNKAQGLSHAGEFLVVDADGNITTRSLTVWQGGTY